VAGPEALLLAGRRNVLRHFRALSR
jgi:hypothetical protein